MAAESGGGIDRAKPQDNHVRRRKRHSLAIQKNIDEDVLMASAIGDVNWLHQSLWDERKANAKSKEHGLGPIHLAAKHGQLDCLKTMVEKYKIDVNLQSETGWTPLHLAINTDNKKRANQCVAYLLENGANPSQPNYAGHTPVHQAAAEGHVKCLQELIAAGAIIDSVDSNGNTPMDLARVWGHRICARILANRQWYLDKQKYLEEKREEEKREKELEEEVERFEAFKRVEGRNKGQIAFKNWLREKHFPDIPTMYGPLSSDERRVAEELKKKRRSPTTITLPGAKGSSVVIQSHQEIEILPSFMKMPLHGLIDSDDDKKLELIPLERTSASRRNRLHKRNLVKTNS